MPEQLSSFRIRRGRRVFDSFSAINSFSFALVTGNTVTLFALALGASSTIVGLLSACMYASFFAIPLGKILLRKISLVKAFGHCWMLRNWSLLPIVSAPYLVSRGHTGGAVFALVLGVVLFNFFRGIGLIANNPVIGILSPGKDRGEYIVRLSLINNGTALLATVCLAFLLWRDAGVLTYTAVVGVGIATGVVASALVYRLPDPPGHRVEGPSPSPSPIARMVEYLAKPDFRRFVLSFLFIGLGIGMARPFITVFCKGVYGQNDGLVTVFSVCSSLGALGMGLVMRLVIDRLGAKPMYIIFAAVSLASVLPAIVAPGVGSATFSVVFLCLLSAVTNMGFAGQESAAQTYFFAMVPKEAIMDLSVLYYFVMGGTGAIGALVGGSFLDVLSSFGLAPIAAFRVFFAVSVLFVAWGIRLQKKLPDLGSYPVRDTIAVLFSPRDMRALTLLRKLDASVNPDEETEIIAELGEVASEVSSDVLLQRLSSPRFAVRYEALQSVESLKRLNGKLRDALFAELASGEFGTAALAARFLGKFGVVGAIPALESALSSPDYRLVGESMLSLARLDAKKSQFLVSDVLLASKNPFVLVRGVQAMTEYGTAASVPILLDLLRDETLPPHVADETILSLSDLMGVPRKFYYEYESYCRDRRFAKEILLGAYDELSTKTRREDESLKKVLGNFIEDPNADADFVRWFMGEGKGHAGVYAALLVGVALDSDLNRQEPFRFFLCFWALSSFADRALIEK